MERFAPAALPQNPRAKTNLRSVNVKQRVVGEPGALRPSHFMRISFSSDRSGPPFAIGPGHSRRLTPFPKADVRSGRCAPPVAPAATEPALSPNSDLGLVSREKAELPNARFVAQ